MLDGLLATLRANHCPAFLVRKLFQQLFSFVNVQARPCSPSRQCSGMCIGMPYRTCLEGETPIEHRRVNILYCQACFCDGG